MPLPTLKGSDVFLKGELFTQPVRTSVRGAAKLHKHDFYEIFFLVRGEMLHNVGGMCQFLKQGNAVFIRPDDAHSFDAYRGANCDFINVAFDSSVLDEMENFYGCPQTREQWHNVKMPCVDVYDPEGEAWKALLVQANACMAVEQDGTVQRVRIKSMIMGLYAHFIQRLLREETQPDVPYWLQALCERLAYPDQLTQGVEAIRSLCYYSYEHVSRCFQRYFHVTPTQYILNLRLSYTAQQLAQTRRNMIDIALDAGFSSYSYFNRAFAAKYGRPPARYRRENSRFTV